ncbi:MAG: rod shape-determining protein MreC [Candidatus Omnitrophica bacterium CG1_02_49_10]|nr:MAG: rod shape-determining protein MreC [Candidatus Omnitrophica bacterium CG1_02_49_10]
MKMALLSQMRYIIKAADSVSKNTIYIFRIPRLAASAEELKRRLYEAEAHSVDAEELMIENERLRELLNLKKRYQNTSIAASVIGRDITGWADSIIIDKGSRDGIVSGMAVISHGGLVGKVYETGPYVSNIILISDANSKVSAILQNEREAVLLIGYGSGMCGIKYIPSGLSLNPEEPVITSGDGGLFPKGLLIGKVGEARYAPGMPYKEAEVTPAEDLASIEEVLCLKQSPK